MSMPLRKDDPVEDLTFPLANLSCAGCVRRAEAALEAVPGVRSAAVNLATRDASIKMTPDTTRDSLYDALKRAGYPVQSATMELELNGMTCASCVARAESVLMERPEVLRASVNLATSRAQIDHISGQGDSAALIAALTSIGYPARLIPSNAAPDDPQTRHAAEARSLRNATLLAVVLTMPVFVLEMGGHLVPAFHHWLHHQIGMQTLWVVQFVLTTLILVGPGRRFYRVGFPALWRGAPDMNSLVAMGTFAAWAYSVIATFLPGLLPETARAVYFEAAAVIVTLILLGRWLEERAKGRTGAAISRLVGLQPRAARVLRDGDFIEVDLNDLVAGDIVQLRPGERIPADGVLAEGTAVIDESMITGEPVPADKTQGDRLIGGTVNGAGAFRMEITRTGADTMLAQIIRMVETAQGAKLPVQALVDRVTMIFVPVVLGVAALTVALWLALGPDLTFALVAGVSVLIIACPCAMGLATPTSVMVATGRAAELGVLFRKGSALQSLDKVQIIAFDKTGTLTEGRPVLTDLETVEGWQGDDALALAAALEQSSEHPVARAILSAAGSRNLRVPDVAGFKSLTGQGVRGQIDERAVALGAARLMAELGVDTGPLDAQVAALSAQGRSPLYLAADGQLVAVLAVADKPRKGAGDMVAALKTRDLRVAMISGDAKSAANAVARELGIDEVVAEVMPKGKVDTLKDLRARFGPIAFVGDGINDAPALAEADIGIAIGTGTDVAVETADVVLVSGKPEGVLAALEVSHRAMRNIRQNLFWAFAYNTALIPVAAGLLYPAFGLMLSPMLAAGAMALSSICVLSNALRLRYIDAPKLEAAA